MQLRHNSNNGLEVTADAVSYLLHTEIVESFFSKYGDYLRSDRYLFTAFGLYEGLAINLLSAIGFLWKPTFIAKELAPRYKDDKFMEHPVIKMLLRLFGATEVLVAGLFVFVLNRQNAKKYLAVVLTGDILHFMAYTAYTYNNFEATAGVLAHYVTMSSVIATKLLYFAAHLKK